MLSSDEILGVCVGELYRYRLAVQDQLVRVDAATRAVRAERALIARDEEELLVAPSMSDEAIRGRLETIRCRDTVALWRLKTEAQFLLSAVYGILSMSRAIRAATVGEVNACVQRTMSAFEKAAPDADLLRHPHLRREVQRPAAAPAEPQQDGCRRQRSAYVRAGARRVAQAEQTRDRDASGAPRLRVSHRPRTRHDRGEERQPRRLGRLALAPRRRNSARYTRPGP
jgi:hypothetical protein